MNLLYLRVILLGVCCVRPLAATHPSDGHRYGESSYFIVKEKVDWYRAKYICAESRANLAVPKTQSEQDYIWELFLKEFDQNPSTDLWIGCNDIEEEGNWQHCPLKGETNAFENWAEEEPNNDYGADCGLLWVDRNGKWDDYPCNEEIYAVCETTVSNTPKFCLQTGKDGRLVSPEHSSTHH